MKHLTSRHNPLVSAFRAVADGSDRRQILIDGIHLVSDAIRAGVPLSSALVAGSELDDAALAGLVAALVESGAVVCSASPPVMNAVSPVRSSSPIVALAARPQLDRERWFASTPVLGVCAVDVQDPGNVGAIVRVAEAAGASGVAVAGRSADPYGWKALRGAMGSAFRLPLLYPCDAAALADEARRRNLQVVATTPRGGGAPDAVDFTRPTLILVGSEGSGLDRSLIAAADAQVTIPMAPAVESLNTAVCAALLVYEAQRQRRRRAPAPADERDGLALPRRT